jgi:hypothetical protein
VVDEPAVHAAFMLRSRAHHLQFDADGTIDIWSE